MSCSATRSSPPPTSPKPPGPVSTGSPSTPRASSTSWPPPLREVASTSGSGSTTITGLPPFAQVRHLGRRGGAAVRAGPAPRAGPVRHHVPRRVTVHGSRGLGGATGRCGAVMGELAGQGIHLEMLDLGGGIPARYVAPVPSLATVAGAIGGRRPAEAAGLVTGGGGGRRAHPDRGDRRPTLTPQSSAGSEPPSWLGASRSSASPASWVSYRRSPAALGALSGVAFGGFALAGCLMPAHDSLAGALGDPVLWAAVGYAALGLGIYGAALQRGSITAVTATTIATEALFPSAVRPTHAVRRNPLRDGAGRRRRLPPHRRRSALPSRLQVRRGGLPLRKRSFAVRVTCGLRGVRVCPAVFPRTMTPRSLDSGVRPTQPALRGASDSCSWAYRLTGTFCKGTRRPPTPGSCE